MCLKISYGCLKFLSELWAGRACAGTNQQELTTCAKSGGQHKKKFTKKGAGRRPALGQRLVVPAGCGSTPGQGRPGLFFLNFFFFDASSYTLVNFLLEVWGMG
jgi:hypothetical protein